MQYTVHITENRNHSHSIHDTALEKDDVSCLQPVSARVDISHVPPPSGEQQWAVVFNFKSCQGQVILKQKHAHKKKALFVLLM